MTFERGTLIADRFEIEHVAGSGGMGVVYRALDRHTAQPVALKVLHKNASESQGSERFIREAELLAELRHPHIVAYVTHGEANDGQNYLAMEWLEGEDLARRLTSGGLTLHESITCLRTAAAALAVAHQRGIVHRDLKPQNLFLRHGRVDRTTILDFGIARPADVAETAQPTEAGVGTPLYMSPEQARGEADLGPSADIFSLGCVMYECLTGKPPFTAAHTIAVLARILCEEAPSVQLIRPEVPQPLAELLARMLAKDPRQRPQDAGALLKLLDELGDLGTLQASSEPLAFSPPGRWLKGAEQRLACVMVSTPVEGERQTLGNIVKSFGGQVEWLLDRSLMMTLASPHIHSALDLVNRAARCALAVMKHGGIAQLALAICRAADGDQIPIGEVIDHAASLLQARPRRPHAPGEILLDPVCASLLSRRFAVTSEQGVELLGEEISGDDSVQKLPYGRLSFVGRDSELGSLDAFWNHAIEESEACLAVVMGPPGSGKTRLSREFLRGIRARGESVMALEARGEPTHLDAPYKALEDAIGRWPQAPESLKLALQQARESRGARQDQVRKIFADWLRAESEKAPVLLVLDDAQWADSLTVATLGWVLTQLASAPFFLLVLGRTDGNRSLTEQWAGHELHQLTLKWLSKRASERLISQALQRPLAPDAMARIVGLSGGNPLFIEELLQTLSAGKEIGESETVIAMLQARLGGLPTAARRTVLTASLFGQTFSLSELLGFLGDDEPAEIDTALRILEEAELIERTGISQHLGDTEYAFRHSLVRDAAYGLLSERDRQQGSRVHSWREQLRLRQDLRDTIFTNE